MCIGLTFVKAAVSCGVDLDAGVRTIVARLRDRRRTRRDGRRGDRRRRCQKQRADHEISVHLDPRTTMIVAPSPPSLAHAVANARTRPLAAACAAIFCLASSDVVPLHSFERIITP